MAAFVLVVKPLKSAVVVVDELLESVVVLVVELLQSVVAALVGVVARCVGWWCWSVGMLVESFVVLVVVSACEAWNA